jgi:NTP pyrophosphatase (non-canonical NTP hydrolase)
VKHLAEDVELVSQAYAEQFDIARDATWFVLKLQEEVGKLIQAYLMLSGKARTKGKTPADLRSAFNTEVADVFCHTLLLARYFGADLETEVQEKWLAWNRP